MKNPTQNSFKFIVTGLCLLFSLLAHNVQAVTNYYLDVNGATTNSGIVNGSTYTWENSIWSTASTGNAATGNFVDGNFPEFSAGTDGGTASYTVNAGSTHTVAGMLERNSSGTVTLTGSALTITNGAQGFLVGPGSLVINNVLTGPGGIVPECNSGCGNITLNGNNNYSGGFYMGGANIVFIGNANALGTGPLNFDGVTFGAFGNDGVMDFLGNYTIPNAVNMGSGIFSATTNAIQEQFIFNDAAAHNMTFSGNWTATNTLPTLLQFGNQGTNQTFTISGNITNATGLTGTGFTNYGTGTLILTGNNTFGGTYTQSGAGAVTTIGGAGTVASTLKIANTGTFNYGSSAAQSISGIISGSGTLNQYGPGTLTLSGVNTYTGNTTINGGILSIDADVSGSTRLGAIPGTATAGNVTLNGGTLQHTSTGSGSTFLNGNRGIAIGANGGTISIPSSAAILIYTSGQITGSGNVLTKTGPGTLRVTTPTSITFSKLAVTGGLYQAAADNIFGAVPGSFLADAITLNGGGISVNAGVTFSANRGITLGASGGTIDGASNPSVPGVIAGSGGLTKTGTSTCTLSGINTYTGATTISGGTLTIGTAGKLNSGNYAGLITNNAAFVYSSSAAQILSGVISGTGTLTESGSGSLTLTGPNTYAGGTTLGSGGGVLNFGNASALSSGTFTVGGNSSFDNTTGSDLTVANAFTLSGGSPIYVGSTNNMTINGAVTISGTNRTITVSANTLTLGSGIGQDASARSFTKAGNGTLALSGVNTYTGNTTVSGGTLALGSSASLDNTAAISIAAGATLDVSAISSYALSATNTLTASGAASAATIKGGTTVSLGSRPITLTFDGSHPALSISQGTLSLNGNAITVNGSALAPGAYTLIQQASGSIASSGSFSISGTAIGAGTTGSISVSGGAVILTVLGTPTFSNLIASPSITYGATMVTLSGTVSSTNSSSTNYAVNGDTVTAAINGHTVAGTVSGTNGVFSIVYNDASLATDGFGSYPITYAYAGNAGAFLNAATNNSSTSLTVGKAAVTVTAGAQSKTYGQTIAFGGGSTNFTSSGLKNGETIGSVTLASSGGVSNAVVSSSPYTITPSAATGGSFSTANYNISYANGALTVNAASLTVTASSASRAYGATNPIFSVTYTNFANGETLGTSDVAGSPALTTGADTNSPVGVYDITNSLGTLTSTNYSFSLVNGSLTVTNALSTNTVTTSTNPALPGGSVTFTATLSALAPSLAVPDGSVQFVIDGSPYGAPVPLTNGVAVTNSAALSHGAHSIEADYAGNTNIVGSTNMLSELINTPPVAGSASYGRPRDIPLNLSVTNLLTNASDADGDVLSLLSVSATSTNGATIMLTNGFVSYTPPSTNGNVTDTFTYTVSDSYGATNTGTVTVTILPDDNGPSVNITGITTLSNGTVQISFAGIPNRNYLVQATTNVTPPISWLTISTNTAGTNGLFQYTDLNATNYTTRYYRTAKP